MVTVNLIRHSTVIETRAVASHPVLFSSICCAVTVFQSPPIFIRAPTDGTKGIPTRCWPSIPLSFGQWTSMLNTSVWLFIWLFVLRLGKARHTRFRRFLSGGRKVPGAANRKHYRHCAEPECVPAHETVLLRWRSTVSKVFPLSLCGARVEVRGCLGW